MKQILGTLLGVVFGFSLGLGIWEWVDAHWVAPEYRHSLAYWRGDR